MLSLLLPIKLLYKLFFNDFNEKEEGLVLLLVGEEDGGGERKHGGI